MCGTVGCVIFGITLGFEEPPSVVQCFDRKHSGIIDNDILLRYNCTTAKHKIQNANLILITHLYRCHIRHASVVKHFMWLIR
jgi:hypothetical protein